MRGGTRKQMRRGDKDTREQMRGWKKGGKGTTLIDHRREEINERGREDEEETQDGNKERKDEM